MICTRDDEYFSTFAYRSSPQFLNICRLRPFYGRLHGVKFYSYSLNSDLSTQNLIHAVIKSFERSTVERIEENSNVSRCLFIRCKYGHWEMRNKKLINRRKYITQGWQFCSPLISPWKRKGKKRKKIITTRGIRSRSPSQVLPTANRA